MYYRKFSSVLGLFFHLMSVTLFILVIITRISSGMPKRALQSKDHIDHSLLTILEINEFNYFR